MPVNRLVHDAQVPRKPLHDLRNRCASLGGTRGPDATLTDGIKSASTWRMRKSLTAMGLIVALGACAPASTSTTTPGTPMLAGPGSPSVAPSPLSPEVEAMRLRLRAHEPEPCAAIVKGVVDAAPALVAAIQARQSGTSPIVAA